MIEGRAASTLLVKGNTATFQHRGTISLDRPAFPSKNIVTTAGRRGGSCIREPGLESARARHRQRRSVGWSEWTGLNPGFPSTRKHWLSE